MVLGTESGPIEHQSLLLDAREAIGSATPVEEIVHALAKRGCTDLTLSIDLGACSDFPRAGGGFCDVYRGALHNSHGTRIAIKSLRVYDGSEAEGDNERRKILKRAARELYHWSKLQHRNVLPLLGLAIFRGQLSMVSEWMENGNLMSYLRFKPDADRNRLCMDVCEGLCYIHLNGMIHGDLKAANVMVSSRGIAMIADFGNTQLKDLTLRFSNTAKGGFSVRWAAPELLSEVSDPQVGKEADVYAYGMTMLETLTSKVPYEGMNDNQVFILVAVKEKVPPRPNIDVCDDDLWDLLNSCWNREPSGRPSITIVKDRLQIIFWPPTDARLIGGAEDSATASSSTLDTSTTLYAGQIRNTDSLALTEQLAAGQVDIPRRKGRRAIKLMVVANPDGSDEDKPANSATYYTAYRPRSSTGRAQSPRRMSKGVPKELYVTPSPPSGEDSDNSEAESSRGPAQTVAAQFPSVSGPFPPPQRPIIERIVVTVTHDTENYVVVDLSGHTDAQAIRECMLSKLHIPDDLYSSFSIYRTEFGGFAIGAALDDTQLLIDCQRFGDDMGSLKFLAQRSDAPAEGSADPDMSMPPVLQPSASERIIVAATRDAENYVVVDLTDHTDAQAIRERMLSKLHIPDDLHSGFSIYRTEIGALCGFAIGAALDDTQLLIDCQYFGDDKGSLMFFAQRSDDPAEDEPEIHVPNSTIAPVPPMPPSLSSFTPGPRRTLSSDRLVNVGYEGSVLDATDFPPNDEMQIHSPTQTLHRRPASRPSRQPSTSWRVRRRGSGTDIPDMGPVAPASVPTGSLAESSTNLPARTQEHRGSFTPTAATTRSPSGFEDPAVDPNVPSAMPAVTGSGTAYAQPLGSLPRNSAYIQAAQPPPYSPQAESYPQAPPQQVHNQQQPYTQWPYPAQQQPYHAGSGHTIPPPPRGAMLPRNPGSECLVQATQLWSYDQDTHR